MENSRVVNLRMPRIKKTLLWVFGILALILIGYNIWAYAGRAKEKKTGWVDLPPAGRTRFREFDIGRDLGKGNILVVQPYLTPQNYSTAFNFFVSLKMYLRQAKRDSLIKANTLVVFPEHIGTWLFAMNEKEAVYNKSNMRAASNLIFFSNFFSMLQPYFSSTVDKHKMSDAILHKKAQTMAEVYDSTFSSLAKEYRITIIAGSIVLPEPYVTPDGRLRSGNGQLFNVYPTYNSSGAVEGQLIKSTATSGTDVSNDSTRVTASNELHGSPFPASLCISGQGKQKPTTSLQNRFTQVTVTFHPFSSTNLQMSKSYFRNSNSPAPGNDSSASKSNRRPAMDDSSRVPTLAKGAIGLRFAGDLWDQYSDGSLHATVSLAGNDSIIELGSAERRGRIVNYWLY